MIRLLSILLLVALVVAGAAGVFGWRDYQHYLEQPVAISGETVPFSIERGWSARRVSRELVDRGIIDKPHWFDLYARLNDKAAKFKSGEFELSPGQTVPDLVDTFVGGQTRQYTHSVIEGSNWREVMAQLQTVDSLEHTLGAVTETSLMTAIGAPDLHPEGQFFADTYRFPKGTTDVDYLQRSHAALNRILDEEWQARDQSVPLKTPYEALILASIVEKETAVPAERPLIAGVFLSRINKGMRLQTDPTVIYGMGESYDGNIRRKDLTTDTPYNTYTRGGLPPTPIAMVGREAIHAVLHPETTTSLYFVAKGDGTHQFSDTVDEHNAAVRQYQLKR